MTTPQERAAAFWQQLCSAEAQRRALSKVTHEMRAKVQARVSANDEPEPAEIRAERRGQP